jgi:tRNA(Ile)-lysidine synthase TilS/MesJ
MKICSKCVLTGKYPGIYFDDKNVCNYCNKTNQLHKPGIDKQDLEQRFTDLIKEIRNKSPYDCILAFSGGKDSTYTLDLLKNKYHLNILAVSFNNWFQSERAAKNIQTVIKSSDVDHLTLTPRYNIFIKMIRSSINENIYSAKSLERTSAICTTCLSVIRYYCLRLTIEKKIPLLVFALSPGQAPINTSIFKMNSKIIRMMQNVVFQPLIKSIGEEIRPYFLEERHFQEENNFPYSINPLAFLPYDEKKIYSRIKSLGWQAPQDTDPNSTNCLLNAYANKQHQEKYGYHPYAYEISTMVREGVLTREEGLRKLAEPGDMEVIESVRKKLEGGLEE